MKLSIRIAKLDDRLLEFQQVLLSPQASPITAERAVAAHHAMTGDDDGDAIVAVGLTDCPACRTCLV